MPFVPNTPESLIARSDSRNPSSTCRGITASGRPCRRPIATASPNPSPGGSSGLSPGYKRRVSARPTTPDPRDESLYCWQHREQASYSAHSSPGPRATATPILEEPRTSLDTLADRLGLVELQEREKARAKKHKHKTQQQGQHAKPQPAGQFPAYAPAPPKPKPKPRAKATLCFCFSISLEERTPPPRPQPRPVQKPASVSRPPRKPAPGIKTTSDTARIKDLIPDTLDSITASALMAELARPYVDSEEAGYIYMFWLTPVVAVTASRSAGAMLQPPPVDAARSLLAPPPPRGGNGGRRSSDVVSSFANAANAAAASGGGTSSSRGAKQKKGTMLLKIGRAANVQRRMNQWQRQCDYEVEMLRYYPYISSSAAPSPSNSASSVGRRSNNASRLSASAPPGTPGSTPRPTPHAHRVERLVHIELAGMGLRAGREACAACGREHREWFEVEASRAAVGKVDEVIRRWVEYDEQSAS